MKDLRDRMIEDMKLRSLAQGTQRGYLDAITALAAHYRRRPDQLSEQQIREYLLYLIEIRKFAKSTFKIHLAAIKFLYQRTLGRPWPVLQLPRIKTDKKLPVVLSREEVWTLLDRVRQPQAHMSLTLMYTCGLRVSEALHLRVEDIDSQRRVVWVRNGKGNTLSWLQQRQAELLPVPYYHVIFTLPGELRGLVRLHQKQLYALIMQSAARTLLKLAADPHYVGVMAVMHTWGSNLAYHPHVHCLLTGGGVSADRQQWLPARDDYLVPVRALSRVFRGKVLDGIRRELPHTKLPSSLHQKDWVVHCKPAVYGTQKVLEYLGRYIHRIAITNSRILSVEDGKVTFKYRNSRTVENKTMTLDADEFIRRSLQHVLPSGFHKVRYYGLWSPSYRDHLHKWQDVLDDPATNERPASCLDPANEDSPSPQVQSCPYCKTGTLIHIKRLPPQGRVPP